ncbi:MAG: glycosyltransferase [Pirellulales bacterium]|nr:glycosyltransferase [Pirellulales bacterium]
MSVYASVVVPTFRRNDLLRRCLETLARQTLAASRYEVIVADDAGDWATARLVRECAKSSGVDFRYVAVGTAHGPAAARNCGWRAARGRIIAFTDDDCLPESTWLACGIAVMNETGAAAASGRVRMPLPPRPTDYQRDCAGLATAEFVTANCFCRRDALERVSGFDERFTAAWREDSDLQFTLLERGYRIVCAPQAVVVHPVRPAPWGVSLRQQRKSQFNVLLYKKHPQLYRRRIGAVSVSYYLAAASLAAMAFGALAGMTLLVGAAAACWLGVTAGFCWRRLRGASLAPAHVAEMVFTSAIIPLLSLYWRARGVLKFQLLGFREPLGPAATDADNRRPA